MTTLVANEFLKLRTIRSPWLLLAIELVIIVAGTSGVVAAGLDVHAPTAVRELLSHAAGVSALFTLVLGITAVAGEYRHRTITDTYLATPQRVRVIVAKLTAYTAAGIGFGVAGAAITLAVTAYWLNTKGAPLDTSSPDVWRALVGIVAWNALYAAIGVSLGALNPNLTGAVSVALAWIAVGETIVNNLLGDLGRWLPRASAFALGYAPNPDLLPQWGAALVLAGYAAAFALLAAETSVRRDVT